MAVDLNTFITWGMFADFTAFIAIVVMIVQFVKELPLIKKVPTKYLSALVSFSTQAMVAVHDGTFKPWDLFLYAVTAISVSAISKGLIEYHNDKTPGEIQNEVNNKINGETQNQVLEIDA